MPEGVHVHAPHELTEASEAVSGRERLLELVAVLFVSLATVCIAWSGYQAARWSGIEARHYAQASTARSLANRAATLGGQQRIQDLLNFNRWLETSTSGDQEPPSMCVASGPSSSPHSPPGSPRIRCTAPPRRPVR